MMHQYTIPIEMPRGTHYGSDYWIAYSYKLKRKVHFYSMLEYANFLTLEMNPNVVYFCEQPLKIEDSKSSSKKVSIFDFWVAYKDNTCEFQEVKYSSEVTGNTDSSLRSQRQIDFQRNWCAENSQNYKVVTEKDLYVGPFLIQNLELLHSHLLRYGQVTNACSDQLLKVLRKNNLTICEIKSLKILPKNYELSILSYLLYYGDVEIKINDRPLDNSTEVKLCEIKNTIC